MSGSIVNHNLDAAETIVSEFMDSRRHDAEETLKTQTGLMESSDPAIYIKVINALIKRDKEPSILAAMNFIVMALAEEKSIPLKTYLKALQKIHFNHPIYQIKQRLEVLLTGLKRHHKLMFTQFDLYDASHTDSVEFTYYKANHRLQLDTTDQTRSYNQQLVHKINAFQGLNDIPNDQKDVKKRLFGGGHDKYYLFRDQLSRATTYEQAIAIINAEFRDKPGEGWRTGLIRHLFGLNKTEASQVFMLSLIAANLNYSNDLLESLSMNSETLYPDNKIAPEMLVDGAAAGVGSAAAHRAAIASATPMPASLIDGAGEGSGAGAEHAPTALYTTPFREEAATTGNPLGIIDVSIPVDTKDSITMNLDPVEVALPSNPTTNNNDLGSLFLPSAPTDAIEIPQATPIPSSADHVESPLVYV